MNGFIYYRGPSQINGDPIIGICTLESDNPKTGNMAQAWILHDTIHPVEAVQSGKDKAICGDCTAKDVCYVTVGFAPAQVWKNETIMPTFVAPRGRCALRSPGKRSD